MATVTKKKSVDLTNIGAVKHLALEIPEEGGIVVLQGRNGRGKTTAIKAIQSALSGSGSLEVNDHALNGSVDAFGVTITVGKSTRRKGELEVQSLEGKLSLGDLIDPMLKTPEAADAKRIKALVQLSGTEASPALFSGLLGPGDLLKKLCQAGTLKHTDPVAMAEAIKRDLEAEARREEDAAQKAEGVALGATEALGDLDLSQEHDAAKLQAELEKAVAVESNLAERVRANHAACRSVQLAREQIEAQEAEYSGASLDDCRKELDRAHAAKVEQGMKVDELRGLLRIAEETLSLLQSDCMAADRAVQAAERHEKTIAASKAALEATIPNAPCPEELEAAKAATQSAREALERGALIRKGLQHLAAKESAQEDAKQHSKQAKLLRDAGKATDEVLSGIVQRLGTSLRVNNGRLVLDTHRGETYYHELSDGERAKIAIEIAIGVVGEGGVITLDQRIYEGIDPINRVELANLLKARKATMLTAEVSADDEIKAGVL